MADGTLLDGSILELSSLDTQDRLYVVHDPNGTPVDNYATIESLFFSWGLEKNVITFLDFATAVSTISTNQATLYVPSATTVSADLTVPANVTLRFGGVGVITVSSGKVLTIKGAIQAPLRQIFAGAGAVAGLALSYPEWFGAKRDGKVVIDGSMNNASATLSSATAAFTSADATKIIDTNQTGSSTSSARNNQSGTISGFTNSTTVTLSFSAGHTIADFQFIYGTDDTAAMLKAIAAIGTRGKLQLSAGIYLITAQLSPASNQSWVGDGKSVTIIHQLGVVRNSSGTSYSAINLADGTHDVTFKDFSVRGANSTGIGLSSGGALAFGFLIGNGSGGATYNVKFLNVEASYTYGIGFRSLGDSGAQSSSSPTTYNIDVLNCAAVFNSDNGCNINATRLTINTCVFTDNGAGGIEVSAGDIKIINNYVARNVSVGIAGGGLGNPSLAKNCIFAHNIVERNGNASTGGAGISIGGNIVSVIVDSNVCRENAGRGIDISDGNPDFASLSRDIRVTHNQVVSNGLIFPGVGIAVGINDAIVANNDIYDDLVVGYAQYYGILVSGCDGAKLLRNSVHGSTGYDYEFVQNTNTLLVRDDGTATIQQYEPNGWTGTVDTSSTTATWKTGPLFSTRWVGTVIKVASVYYAVTAVAAAPTGNFNQSSLVVTRSTGPSFSTAWVGKYIRLGASLYFPIASVADGDHLTISNSIGNTVPTSGAWTLNGSVSLTTANSLGTQTGAAFIVPPHVRYLPNNSTLQTVPFTATPTFDPKQGNTFKITLTANVTSSVIMNGDEGQEVAFIIVQDSGSARTFAYPSTVYGATAIGSSLGLLNVQSFRYTNSTWLATGAGKQNMP